MAGKRYTSVSEMLRDIGPDEAFAGEFEKHVAQRRLVKLLLGMRACKGLSQKDIADKLGCSQSRISKIENGMDDNVRIGDLQAYATALGQNLTLVFSEQRSTLVDKIKYHAINIKQLLDRLVELAGTDHKMAQGVAGFFGETFFNLIGMIQDSAKRLPQRLKDRGEYCRIEILESHVVKEGIEQSVDRELEAGAQPSVETCLIPRGRKAKAVTSTQNS